MHVIERRFARAAAWCAAGAALSALGLMHSYRFTQGDTALELSPAWPWAIGYGCLTALFLAARVVTEPGELAEIERLPLESWAWDGTASRYVCIEPTVMTGRRLTVE